MCWRETCRRNRYALPPALPLLLPPVSARLHARVFALILAREERKIETGVQHLRGYQFLVAEQCLHRAQIASSLQQVDGKSVAQQLRMHIYPRQAGGGVVLDVFGDTAVAETATLFIEKERRFVCTSRQIAPY